MLKLMRIPYESINSQNNFLKTHFAVDIDARLLSLNLSMQKKFNLQDKLSDKTKQY